MPLRRRHPTDEPWGTPEPPAPERGRPGHGARAFAGAAPSVAKAGAAGRDLPGRYGHWNSVWRRFSRWGKAGRREKFAGAPGEPDLSEPQPDGASTRAHQQASNSRRRPGEDKKPPTPGGASGGAGAD